MSTMSRKNGLPGQQVRARGTGLEGVRRESSASSARGPDAVTPDRIRGRAYEIYQARAGSGRAGDATADWLQAEQELNGSAAGSPASADIEAKARSRGDRVLASAT